MRLTKKFMTQFRQDNDLLRRTGHKPRSLEEYVTYRSGNSKPTLRGVAQPEVYIRPSPKVPSLETKGKFAPTRKEMQYTGNELAGIGTMHKSNSVPVRKDSNDAIDIARMRR